jgi:iron complex outermembrane recepter protein
MEKKYFCLIAFLCFAIFSYAQNTIKGFVFDENGKPYQGASIVVTQGGYRTFTDKDGMFLIETPSGLDYELSITALGYKNIKQSFKAGTLHSELSFDLTPFVQQLNEVKVSSNYHNTNGKYESAASKYVDAAFLIEAKASSLMQTLNKIPGIGSMDIGSGMSKPMIRGMGYYRVAVAQNGLKFEGQQWSSHHGISIDQQAVGEVEIIKGPASLQYGSDAIGGVINVLPVKVPQQQGLKGELSLLGKSNARWMGASANIALRKNDRFAISAISYNTFGDFRIPETDAFLLPAPVSAEEASHQVPLGNTMHNTAGKDIAFSFLTGIVKPWGKSSFDFNYVSSHNGFFDWQGLRNDSIRAEHAKSHFDIKLPRQKVAHFTLNHFTTLVFDNDQLEIALGYQSNNSKEYSYLDNRTGNRTATLNAFREQGHFDLGLFLHTLSGNVSYTIRKSDKQVVKLGLNTQYLFHKTDGYHHVLPEYQRFSSGVFVTHQYRFSDEWIMNSGLRFDFTHLNLEGSLNPDPEFGDLVFNPAFSKNYPGTAFSIGVNFLPTKETVIKAHVGKSFRIPSAYELGAYGLHRHEGRFEKGDISNRPEKAWQLDVGAEHKWGDLNMNISPFATYFVNYLYLKPTPLLRPEGQVYEYQQTNALLTGGELAVDYLFNNTVSLSIGAEYVYAVNLSIMGALPFTPPFNVHTEISYLFRDKGMFTKSKLGFELISVAKQVYTVPNELNTPGYNTLNLIALTNLQLGKVPFALMFRVRNLLDAKYYNHIGFYRRLRIPELGRDCQLTISIPL